MSANVFRREGDYWSVIFDGHTVRVRDLKGMRYLARLLADPGREYHVLDLVAAETGRECAGRQQPSRQPAALGIRRYGRDPRRSSQGGLPPTPGRDRRRHRSSARHWRCRAGRAGPPNVTSWFENSPAHLAWAIVIDEQRPPRSAPEPE